MRHFAVCLAALLPMPALACPTGADLANGITIRHDDGASETYRAVRDDLVRMEQSFDGELTAIMDLAHGTYVLTYMDVYDGRPDAGSRITTAYPGGMATLSAPEAGARWSLDTIVMDSAGPYAETVTVAWSTPRDATIGSCTYSAIDGIIAYDGEDETYVEGITYLIDVGVGYVNFYEDSAGRTDYVAIAIEAGG